MFLKILKCIGISAIISLVIVIYMKEFQSVVLYTLVIFPLVCSWYGLTFHKFEFMTWAGVAACVCLIVSCFLPWAHYADIGQTFNGFYSYKNEYGKPGKFLLTLGIVSLILILLPKLWAKRTNLFIAAFTLAYAIKTFTLFASCYNNYCPQKLFGLYLMLGSAVIMLVASVFPNVTLTQKNQQP
jgi:hypothetical protein